MSTNAPVVPPGGGLRVRLPSPLWSGVGSKKSERGRNVHGHAGGGCGCSGCSMAHACASAGQRRGRDSGPHDDFGEPISPCASRGVRAGGTPPTANFEMSRCHTCGNDFHGDFSRPKQRERRDRVQPKDVKLPDRKNIDTGTRSGGPDKCPNGPRGRCPPRPRVPASLTRVRH